MNLKNKLRESKTIRSLIHGYRFAWNANYRSAYLLARSNPPLLFQPYNYTATNRTPDIFKFIQNQLKPLHSACILSFGCSTGEEVFTLRSYFPNAKLVGIDINPRNIAICNNKLKQLGDPKITFQQAHSPEHQEANTFDAILCMSVLRHGALGQSHPSTCKAYLRFQDFEQISTSLARCLKPNGYLVIRGSNFRFCDTDTAAGFEAVFQQNMPNPKKDTPLYGPDNMKLPNALYNDIIFRKKDTP